VNPNPIGFCPFADPVRMMPDDLPALGGRDAALPRAGTVLALDFGEKRIGVAVGELELRIPHALTVISAVPRVARYGEIGKLVAEWRPVLLAVGCPVQTEGGTHALAPLCRKFAHELEGRFRIPVLLVDERFSSSSAAAALDEAGVRGRSQEPNLDAVAAAEILRTLFSEIDVAAGR
jgi:putative Holliday junction resolvase